METELCPCGSGTAYTACCEPFISGEQTPQTPESLLRSRYSAYVKKKVDYIVGTTHPEQRQPESRKTVESWARNARWHDLEIVDAPAVSPDDTEGTVEFVARYTEKGKRQRHHEVAEFRKDDGNWFFYDARVPKIEQYVRPTPKVGRNDPCPCGSGKKYKKCCA